MSKVALDPIKLWVEERVRELVGIDDDVLVGMIVNTLSQVSEWMNECSLQQQEQS